LEIRQPVRNRQSHVILGKFVPAKAGSGKEKEAKTAFWIHLYNTGFDLDSLALSIDDPGLDRSGIEMN